MNEPQLSSNVEIPAIGMIGLDRHFEVGLAIAPTQAAAVPAAKALSAYLDDHPVVPVRLAGLSTQGGRVVLTLAVTLGTIDDVKTSAANAREALQLISSLVEEFAAYDPALALLPELTSAEARLARAITSGTSAMEFSVAVEALVAVA